MKFPDDFINKVINEDCFNILKLIPDKSIDLILTDPPYNLRWKQQIELHGRKAFYHNYKELKEWDKIDKEFYIKIFKEFDRIVKDTGSVIIFCKTELVTWVLEAGIENNFDYKATINYVKSNPVPQCRKKNYCSSFETICWLARWHEKKCLFTFNFKKQKEMHNFIELPICSGKERTIHPTQKPLKLIKHLLEIHSNPGDLVFDPFGGSGTTGVACLELGRKFILIEKDKEYAQIALDRIKPLMSQTKLT